MKTRVFSAPTTVNLEITDVCNAKCRHCYNFWREENARTASLTPEKFDGIVDMLVEAGVFHVVLTGGEPLSRFELLEHALRRLADNNISVSCNSNLMLATDEKIIRLRDAGLDHILTSLNSHDPDTNDYMVNQKGAFKRILQGIDIAVRNGIRVSANMIISQRNKTHVYQTGKLAHELGCQKIFGTRVVPPVSTCHNGKNGNIDVTIAKEDARLVLDSLVEVKKDTGIMIGTLVSYPLCFLGDLEKYSDFVGRGCPAQAGHRFSINANGDTHACVHEEKSYGNIFEISLRKAYQNMIGWRDGSFRFKGCLGCGYIEICQTGCRSSALAYYGALNKQDQLMENKNSFVKHYKICTDQNVLKEINNGARFIVPQRLRFRKENGFYLVNIRWANTMTVSNEVGEFLMKYKVTRDDFSINEFGREKQELLLGLFLKDVVESKMLSSDPLNKTKAGLSIDLATLPVCK